MRWKEQIKRQLIEFKSSNNPLWERCKTLLEVHRWTWQKIEGLNCSSQNVMVFYFWVHETQNKSDAIFVMSSHNILSPLKHKFGILFCTWLVKAYSMPVLWSKNLCFISKQACQTTLQLMPIRQPLFPLSLCAHLPHLFLQRYEMVVPRPTRWSL